MYEKALVAAGWTGQIVCHRTARELEGHLGDIEVLLGWGIPRDLIARMPRLRWIQWLGAGVDRVVDAVPPGVVLTRVERAFSAVMTEHVFAYLLAIRHQLFARRDAQGRHEWLRLIAAPLHGCRLGVAGLGQIGAEIARMGHAFGMEVWGLSRTGRAEGVVDRHFLPEERRAFVSGLDALVLVLPKTADTDGLFGRDEFAAMREGSILINVGRGNAVDEAALVHALGLGRPAYAQLDVFREEPLPPESPLWAMDNCIVTAHCSGPGELAGVEFAFENLRRHAEGMPLEGIVQVDRGY